MPEHLDGERWVPSYSTAWSPGLRPYDPPGPVSIPLPSEPPRDRVIEAVDEDGNVARRWLGTDWLWERRDKRDRFDGDYEWREVVAEAVDHGWSLRHVAGDA
jgi:hypothetical protein